MCVCIVWGDSRTTAQLRKNIVPVCSVLLRFVSACFSFHFMPAHFGFTHLSAIIRMLWVSPSTCPVSSHTHARTCQMQIVCSGAVLFSLTWVFLDACQRIPRL